jgi:predicted CXXCH cytochrome family protein
MTMRPRQVGQLLTGLLLALACVNGALAQEAGTRSEPAAASRTPLPFITRGKGEACVAPTEWMRRNHMKALVHKRDETVYEGDRAPRFSLNACIACHAVPGADGRPVTANDPKHFCRGCHDYTAVRVDCFECHASRPEPGKAAMADDAAHGAASLARYLEGVAR